MRKYDWMLKLKSEHEILSDKPQSGIAKQYDYFTRSRHAQLQKARREIAEGNREMDLIFTTCIYCGKPESKHKYSVLSIDGSHCPPFD